MYKEVLRGRHTTYYSVWEKLLVYHLTMIFMKVLQKAFFRWSQIIQHVRLNNNFEL
jgi:hypothetical protein